MTPEKGKEHNILNPVTGAIYTFTVREYEERKMDPNHFPDESMEWPTNYSIMTYTVFPEKSMKDDFKAETMKLFV